MKNIAVIFGGKSVEHDVSVITGVQVLNALDKQKYNVYPIYINRQGRWFFSESFFDLNALKNFNEKAKNAHEVLINFNDKTLYKKNKNKLKKLCEPECVILAVHGGNGENGALQGLLACCDIPFSGTAVLGSAICMDKIITKYLLQNLGFKVCEFCALSEQDSSKGINFCIDKILGGKSKKPEDKFLKFPIIIKPANLGSSIGINICNNKKELANAIDIAHQYDSRILAEEAITNKIEINASVLGDGIGCEVSLLEKPVSWQQFLTFDEKYIGSKSTKNKDNMREIPAKIGEEQEKLIKTYAKDIFMHFNLSGVVRIDFIIDNDKNEVYVNEINTIPGSLSFYLWDKAELGESKKTFGELLAQLVSIAITEHNEKSKLRADYQSNVLQNYKGGAK